MKTLKKLITSLRIIARYTKEELFTILTDPALLLIFIVANIVYPVVYSIAYQNEQLREISVAVVDEDNTYASRSFTNLVDATEGVNIKYKPTSMEEATSLFYESKVHGILILPKDFEKDILSHIQTTVSIYSDASYFLIYKQVYSAVMMAYMEYIGQIQVKNAMLAGSNHSKAVSSLNPVDVKIVDLYNPYSSYGAFVMPPLLLIILQQTLLIGLGILGGTRKEIERYKVMKNLESSRHGLLNFLFGKSLAYFLTFMVIGAFTLVWVHDWFGYPDKSSFVDVLSLYVPYIVAVTFLGMTISVFFKRRENAIFFMVFLSVPIMFLSGATWPIESIPPILHKLSYIFPSSLMVPAYTRVRMMNADLQQVKPELYGMFIQIAIYSVTAYFAFYYVMQTIVKKDNSKSN